jgi:mitochondrial enoyl-[acyl-carrier protein] reductase / trans-2-enoyl-CoA reductase
LFQFVPEWKSDGTEFVIQNAGNSQVAKYVSQIAKHYKINTISVVRDGKSQGEIDELYSLGATKVISELELSDPNFATHTLRDIIGDGTVRLALNSVGGSTIPHFVKALSQNGVLATFGAISGSDISYSSVDQLFKNITTVAFWLSASTRKDPDFKIKTINDLVDLYKNEQISTPKFNHVHVDNPDALLTDLMTSISNSKNGKQVLIYKKEF